MAPPPPAPRQDAPATRSAVPSVEEYRQRLRDHLADIPARLTSTAEDLPLRECLGRVTARAVAAPVDLPLFRNSQMDGYAVRAAEVADASPDSPASLPVLRTIAAGDPAGPGIEPGTAVKIMTGAALPDGADAVVPVEDTTVPDPGPGPHQGCILVHAPRSVGEFVRRPGDDVRTGDEVLAAGTTLGARHLAAAASLGLATLPVRPRPRVAVLATGAELVPPGTTPGPGEIWDSNSFSLAAAVESVGGTVTVVRVIDDDPGSFTAALDAATGADGAGDTVDGAGVGDHRVPPADLVLTSGAVSKGDFEVVRTVLGARDDAWFGHIAMQPGGPQGLATWAGVPVVCLPGNPVSVLVSFLVLVRGALGLGPEVDAPRRRLPLTSDVRSPVGRAQFLRVTIDDDGVRPLSGPGSHLVATMASADALAEIPADATEVPAGTPVEVWPL